MSSVAPAGRKTVRMVSQAERPKRVVSVVIPVYDDPRLPQCLDALARQTLPDGWELETVVVDNGSSESLSAMAGSYPGVTFLLETRRGSYAARNTGVAVSTGEVVAFTDSDCTPAHDWLRVALDRLERDAVAVAVAGRVKTVFETGMPVTPAGWWEKVEAFPQQRYAANGFGVTANLVVRRSAGDAVGWFDAGFASGGDADFGHRLTAAGRTVVYEDAAVVEHPARTTWHELMSKGRRTAQGRARMEHLRGRGLRGYLISLYSSLVQLGTVLKRSVTHTELEGIRGRAQYLAVGVTYRVVWFVHLCRWRLHYHRQGE